MQPVAPGVYVVGPLVLVGGEGGVGGIGRVGGEDGWWVRTRMWIGLLDERALGIFCWACARGRVERNVPCIYSNIE